MRVRWLAPRVASAGRYCIRNKVTGTRAEARTGMRRGADLVQPAARRSMRPRPLNRCKRSEPEELVGRTDSRVGIAAHQVAIEGLQVRRPIGSAADQLTGKSR